MRLRVLVLTSAATLCAQLPHGLAGNSWSHTVDVEATPNYRSQGSIRPHGDSDRYVVIAPRGATVDVTVKATAGNLDPMLALSGLDPEAGTGSGNSGKKVFAKGMPVETSGYHFVQIEDEGSGEGDYVATISVKPRTAWNFTFPQPLSRTSLSRTSLSRTYPGDSFACPRGSSVILTARSVAGKMPRIESLDDVPLAGEGDADDRSHTVRVDGLAFGEHAFRVSSEPVEGEIRVSVRVIPPKEARTNEDLRAETLGRPAGLEMAMAFWLQSGDFYPSLHDGTACGVATQGTGPGSRFGLFTQPLFAVPEGWRACGIPVRLTSSAPDLGGVQTTLGVPYRSWERPDGAPSDSARVWFLPDAGGPRFVDPFAFGEGSVTVAAQETGRFVTVVPARMPSPSAGGWWRLRLEFGHYGGLDSRARRVAVVASQAGMQEDGSISGDTCRRQTEWDVDDAGVADATHTETAGDESGTWQPDLAPNSLALSDPVPHVVQFSDDGLLGAGQGGDVRDQSYEQGSDLWLRSGANPSMDFPGTYTVAAVRIAPHESGGAFDIGLGRGLLQMTVGADRRVSVRGAFLESRVVRGGPSAVLVPFETRGEWSWGSAFQGELEFVPDEGQSGPRFRVMTGTRGRAFLAHSLREDDGGDDDGSGDGSGDGNHIVLVGVRNGPPAPLRDDAAFLMLGPGARASSYDVPAGDAPDIDAVASGGVLSRRLPGKRAEASLFANLARYVTRRAAEPPEGPEQVSENVPLDELPLARSSDGRFTLGKGRTLRLGAFEPEGAAGIAVDALSAKTSLDFLVHVLARLDASDASAK
ncbi:MAG: hypothetical protein HMLKMBBP_02356 [Planctomycetes bacterium]|nr:hypothetical protein [Planctomycetota bacterium]